MYFMDLKLIAPLKRLNLIVETYPLFDFILTKNGIDLVCNNKHKLFGFQEKGNDLYFINESLLCARFLIYRCKYSKTIPNML